VPWVEHVDTGLTNGITYYYAVFSRDTAGNWNDQVVEGKNADTARPGPGSPQVVHFPDPNLEQAIREAINKPTGDIYDSDLVGLTELDAYERDITTLEGVQYCRNLTTLWLGNNQITDISPLAGLINLVWLDLGGNQISDFSPLAGLVNLEVLYLDWNQISDVSPLGGLVNLQRLYLNGNQISDLSPLAGLVNLEWLSLGGNQISDLSPLARLVNLEELVLGENQITDISPLAGLVNLVGLDLQWNQISDLSPLAGLVNLLRLELACNQISDISPLAGLVNLEELGLVGNQISDLSPLAGLVNLVRLDLNGNQISDLSPLAGLVNLVGLDLQWNQISDLSPLAGLVNLEWLNLGGNQISDISPLAGLVNLVWLELGGNQISDISSLAGLLNLEELGLWQNQISDITPLVANHGLGEGDYVDLRWNLLDVVTPSANALRDIETLLSRGIEVLYEPQRDDVVPEWRRNLQPGDILLCRSPNSPFLYFPPTAATMDWTHVGLYVGEGKVIEAVWSPNPLAPNGVVETSIESWDYPQKVTVEVRRVRDATPAVIARAIQFAKDQLGEPYQMTYVEKDTQGLLGWYCSELVWAAYKVAGDEHGLNLDLDPDPWWYPTPSVVTPDEIAESDKVEWVASHIDAWPTAFGTGFFVYSPVELTVVDPDGLRISSEISEIPNSFYFVEDLDSDGHTREGAVLLDPKQGQYLVEVTPKPEAEPTETFSLSVYDYAAEQEQFLARDVPVQDIPPEPYSVEMTEHGTYVNTTHVLPNAGWHMLALPGELCEPCTYNGCGDVTCALCDDLEGCFIFYWNPEARHYVMAPPPENICYHQGMGFWVRTYEPDVEVDAEVMVPSGPVEVPLKDGWNMIGDPFPFDVPLSSLKVRHGEQELSLFDAQQQGWVSAYLFGYNPEQRTYVMLDPANGVLEAWHGYWMRAYVDCTLVIPPEGTGEPVPAARVASLPSRMEMEPLPPPSLPPLSAQLRVVPIPNPVRDVHTATFRVLGICPACVEGLRVEIFDLAGRLVWRGEVKGPFLEWHTRGLDGLPLANGVYLYKAFVKVDGEWIPTGVGKVAILH